MYVCSLELVVSFLTIVSDMLLNMKNYCCDRPKVWGVIGSKKEESLIFDHENFDDSPSRCSHVHGSVHNRR